jgi:sterol desaturase/sphingolipid hydroxylase (fatty acid hydroxylase superfamily)
MLIPVLCANLIIWAFEFIQPFNLDWRPPGKSLRLDILYAVSTSLLITPLLKVGMLFLIVKHDIISSGIQIWPNDWPLYLQVPLAILVADLVVYCAHRWMHLSDTGWKIHIIHHSTEKMHFWAGSRSHVLNVILIYTGEVGVLLLMGVNTETLAMFTVFTAINGVIEHSNIELRFGFLNRIFSTADLHRVHHSTNIAVSNHNFGTATCIWDQIFGTYSLPSEPVRIQGILMHALPENYWGQLKAPFMLYRYEVQPEAEEPTPAILTGAQSSRLTSCNHPIPTEEPATLL